MSNKIIYNNEDSEIVFLTPNLECGIPLNEIARKDVPAGVPYLILDDSLIPLEHQDYMSAWEADFSNPDGYGIGYEAWFAEQAAKDTE